MGIVARFVVTVLCAAALVTLAGASGGCAKNGGENRVPQWERVTSAQVSGDRPVKLNLGAFRLGDRLRLAWVLSGPEDPPVTLTLRIISVRTGTGYGHTVTPQSGPDAIARRDDQAMSLTAIPGEYRIFFSQRFRPARGPGYDIKLTIYTMRSSR